MSDKFRKVYKKLHDDNAELINEIKDLATQLDSRLQFVASREMSLATTNLEQCIMWATKAVCIEDEKNGGVPVRFPK